MSHARETVRSEQIENLSVAILAGGRSSRMGQNKALIQLPNGRLMIEEIIFRLAPLTDDLILVADDQTLYASLNLRIEPDRVSGTGALGGVYTAVAAARNEHTLVVACDMPFVSPDVVRALAERRPNCDVVACRLDNGEFETMQAIYGKGCQPAMEESLRNKRLRIISFFDKVRVCPVNEIEIRKMDSDLVSFVNLNTPEEFQRYFDAG